LFLIRQVKAILARSPERGIVRADEKFTAFLELEAPDTRGLVVLRFFQSTPINSV
jgi:hypothetical protein